MGQYSNRTLTMYLSVRDCKAPVMFMEARVFSSRAWLFLNRVGVLADGELALDQSLADSKPQREVLPGGVEEVVPFLISDNQIPQLRRIGTAKTVSVRLTGEKGYVSLEPKTVVDVTKDVDYTLRVFDAVSKLVADKGYEPCT